MAFGGRFWMLVGGAALAGAGTGVALIVTRDLTLDPDPSLAEAVGLPGRPLSGPLERGWEHPSEHSEEGRLIRQILASPAEFDRGRLLDLLVHRHPAVRETVLRRLGMRQKGTSDALTVKALLSRLENERDPVVRSAAKSALQEVTGEDRGDDVEAWKSWWTSRGNGL